MNGGAVADEQDNPENATVWMRFSLSTLVFSWHRSTRRGSMSVQYSGFECKKQGAQSPGIAFRHKLL